MGRHHLSQPCNLLLLTLGVLSGCITLARCASTSTTPTTTPPSTTSPTTTTAAPTTTTAAPTTTTAAPTTTTLPPDSGRDSGSSSVAMVTDLTSASVGVVRGIAQQESTSPLPNDVQKKTTASQTLMANTKDQQTPTARPQSTTSRIVYTTRQEEEEEILRSTEKMPIIIKTDDASSSANTTDPISADVLTTTDVVHSTDVPEYTGVINPNADVVQSTVMHSSTPVLADLFSSKVLSSTMNAKETTVTDRTTIMTTVTVLVCDMDKLTHNEPARGETFLVFDWTLTAGSNPGDCLNIMICVTAADVVCETVTPISSSSGSVNITGIIPGTSYAANMTADEGVGSPTSRQSSGNTIPVPPASVDTVVVDSDQITLTINEPSPGLVEYYNITYMNAGGSEIKESEEYVDPATPHIVSSLKAGTTYTFTVHSWSNGEQSPMSTDSANTTTVLIAPVATVTDVTTTTINVTWTPLEATYDRVIVDCVGEAGASSDTDNVTMGMNTGKCEGLTPGSVYTITVTTVKDDKTTPDVSATLTPGTVTELIAPDATVGAVTTKTINVTWTPLDATYDRVIVECIGAAGANNDIDNVTMGVNTGICEGLTPGSVYTITVTTVKDDKTTPDVSATLPSTTVTEPMPPSKVITTSHNTTSISVGITFDPATLGQCSDFVISYQGNGSDTTPHDQPVSCPATTEHALTGLDINTLYEVSVSTVSRGDGTNEKTSVATAPEPGTGGWTFPDEIDAPTTSDVSSRSVKVTWEETTNHGGAAFYVLKVYDVIRTACEKEIHFTVSGDIEDIPAGCTIQCSGATPPVVVMPYPGTPSYTVPDLTPYTNYTFEMVVVNPAGCGEMSPPRMTETLQDVPGIVATVDIIPSNYSMNVSWEIPTEPNGVITSYTVKWCEGDRVMNSISDPGVRMCANHTDTASSTLFTIPGLDAYTHYNISVFASTEIGPGPPVNRYIPTTAGTPSSPQNVVTAVESSSSIHVEWTMLTDSYETGPVFNYTIQATASDHATVTTEVIGFSTRSKIIEALEPHVEYMICVSAYTTDTDNNRLISNITNCPTQRTEESASGAVGGLTDVPNADICHEINIKWNSPESPNGDILKYEVTVQNLDTSAPPMMENVTADEQTYVAEGLDPNNVPYELTVVPINGAGKGMEDSITVQTGECLPTTIIPTTTFPSTPGGNSKTTFDVELDTCSLCHNPNGDISFRGLIITENLNLKNEPLSFSSRTELNAVFKPWNSANWTVGYRTTPGNWLVDLDCSGCSTGSGSRNRRATTMATPTYIYRVGGGDCGLEGDLYCNKELDDSKDSRKFRVRLVLETPGGVLVMEMPEYVYSLDPNNAWIAAPVICCLVLVALILVGLWFMRKKKMGPFKKDRYQQTRQMGTTELGQPNPGFTAIEEPLIDRPSPVFIDNFEQHVQERARDSDLLFAEEYKLIQDLSPHHPTTHSEHPNNRLKNRFVNILPFDHSRVKLLPADDDECSDYINANYMPGYNSKREFIASQGPMKSTVEDFWRMIWEQNVPLIVMVTQLEERGRERCAQYWPNDREPMYYGDLQVQMRSESVLDSYVIRILDVRLGEIERTIKQMHFIRWPDFGVPDNPEMLLDFVQSVRIHLPRVYNGPIMVHCSAGVGRTGSFCAIDRLIQHIREQQTIDIFSIVLEMRNYRSYMIQVEAQYILIHKCVMAAIRRGLHRQRPISQAIPDDPIYANTAFDPQEEAIYENAPSRT